MRHPFFDLPRPLVIGHRGASGERPENTLPSFALALEQGAVILETDVHRTRDGVVVVAHDASVERMTEGRGAIEELSFAELQALDAGYRFSPDRGRSFPWRDHGIRIPSLVEAFDSFPGIRFNIEIKRDDAQLVDATLDAIRDAGREKLTLLAAGEDATMRRVRARLAQSGLPVAQGASPGDVVGFLRAMQGHGAPPPESMALQIPPEFGGQPLVTRELVDFAHAHDVQIHVWTVNERAEMQRLIELGVDGVMSDFPGVLREVAVRHAAGA